MDPPKIRFPNKNEIMMMLNDAQKSVDNDVSKSLSLYLLQTSSMVRKTLWSQMQ